MVNFGNISIADLRLGASQVKALYLGSEQMWSGEEPAPAVEQLCFTAVEPGATIQLDKYGSPDAVSLETSTNGSTWTDYTWDGTTGAKLTMTNVGDKVYFRAKNENLTFAKDQNNRYNFKANTLSGHRNLNVSGNIQTLLKADGSKTDVPAYAFCYLFASLPVVSAGDLQLLATTLASWCYAYMFQDCTSLTTAPELPATTLGQNCYNSMFYQCTSLTSAPALSATTLADNCYRSMFALCSSLTTAPSLPATTLAGNCYDSMFQSCTSLTTAPELPATTLANYCYSSMFQGCSSLTTAPALFATTLASFCYASMFQGCTSLTTVSALPATTATAFCYQNMFYQCTSLTSAPALSATTLAVKCYQNMFQNCTSLNSIKVAFTTWTSGATNSWLDGVAASGTFTCPAALPDTRDDSHIPVGWQVVNPVVAEPLCFTAEEANSQLQLDKVGSPGAVSLEYSTDGVTWSDYTWSGSNGITLTLAAVGDKVYMRAKNENQTFSTDYQNYYRFTNYVAPRIAVSGNIQTLLKADGSRLDAPSYCFRGLFNGCVWLTQAPNLPATTLGSSCYSDMFSGCTSLATAPATLPATTLAAWCYNNMFYRCSSLTTAPTLPATTFADFCYQNMFYNCSQLSSIEVAFSTWPGGATYSTMNWLNGVAASGTFTCPAELPDTRDASHIPTGWTKVDAA